MASLYKKPIVKSDPKTGKKIKSKSKKWWGRYRDVGDCERRVPLASDKSAAQTMLNELVKKVEREKAGLIDPTDRRHDRRALSSLEFSLLIAAAQSGRTIESIPGPDRAMMYILAAWTGFRKGEIGSLTGRSLQLETEPATATVAACFSKRNREDTQILHPEVACMLKKWIAKRTSQTPDGLLFPVSGKVPGGKERKTHKMMQRDLSAARDKWIKAAETDEEKECRLASDMLKYCDSNGRFADFHSNRHLFITSLERANLSPKMAQTLARHSDVRLTLGVYTHVGLHDQTAAIHSLPAPPSIDAAERAESVPLRATKR